MRPALRWALAGAAVSAAAVSWLPADDSAALADVQRAPPAAPAGWNAAAQAAAATRAAPPVAARLAATPAAPSTVTSPPPRDTVRAPWPPLAAAALAAWTPPPSARPLPPPPAASQPAPPPPAFPYRWIGQLEEDGRLRIFVADAQKLWAVGPGEMLGPSWRVDGANADQLQLTWLPTGAAVSVAARP